MHLNMTARLFSHVSAAVLSAALLAGCAATPPADDVDAVAEFEQNNDPLEPTNRAIFAFNQAVDNAVLRPVAEGYRAAVPEFGRDRVHDFLNNLTAPFTFVNDLLQGEVGRAGETFGRFCLNTTFGVLGIMDVATPMGLAPHQEDAGQTFAIWGIGEGPYIVLPLFGPSNPRDAVGLVVEAVADPVSIGMRRADAEWGPWARTGVSAVDLRERYLDLLDEVEATSLDYYSAIRSLYRQRRSAEIRNTNNVDTMPVPGMASSVGLEADPSRN